jgi:hypothetical protein
VGVKLGFSTYGRDIVKECFKRRHRQEYFVLRGRQEEENGENCVMRSFIILTSPNILRMRRACSTHGREYEPAKSFKTVI